MIRGWLTAAVVALGLALSAAAGYAAGEVTVEGNRFYRDGAPWVAEGVTLVGLLTPEARLEKKPAYAAARAAFGPGMLDEVRRFGAGVVRFQVSQAALDPKSKHYDPAYRDDVLAGIAADPGGRFQRHRLDAVAGRRGARDPSGLPSATTRRAWREIAPLWPKIAAFCSKSSTSRRSATAGPDDWKTWAKATQPLIDVLRRAGSENVLLLGGVQSSRSFDGAPILDDPLGQLGYAVHPYLGPHNQTRADWQRKFGDFARTHPVMATAFNAQAGGGYCRPELPEQAANLLAYLHEQRIGLVAWAFDMPNMREPDGSYTTLDDLVCGQRKHGGRGGAGQMIHEYFLAH